MFNVLNYALSPEELKQIMSKNMEDQAKAYLKKLLSRVIDYDGFSHDTVIGLAMLYTDLAPGDISGMISIKKVSDFLENFIRNQYPDIYETIQIYYELNGNKDTNPEKKQHKNAAKLANFFDQVRSIDNALLYSKSFEDACHKIVKVMDAPAGMGLAEIVKYFKIWFFIIKDQEYFDGEKLSNGKVDLGRVISLNSQKLCPETLISVAKYCDYFEEHDISIELIQMFISSFPADVQKLIYDFGELTDLPYRINLMKAIRRDVKGKVFENSTLVKNLNPFFIKSYIRKFPLENLRLAYTAFNAGFSSLKKLQSSYWSIFNLLDYIDQKRGTIPNLDFINSSKKLLHTIDIYQVGTFTDENGVMRMCVNSEQELMLYVNLFNWWAKNPEFLIQGKTFAESGFESLKYNVTQEELMDAVEAWILEVGLASSEKFINKPLVQKLLPMEDPNVFKIFADYTNVLLSANEVLVQLGLKQSFISVTFDTKKKIRFNSKRFQERVSVLSKKHSPSLPDLTILRLYEYLRDTNPVCGDKSIEFKLYGF